MRGRAIIAAASALLMFFLLGSPHQARAQTKIRSNQCCPVKIKKSGSYILTGKLDPGNKNVHAIDVSATDVTIDLNGFSITGPGAGGSGIGVDASGEDRVTVQNGSVSGMGGAGIVVDNYGVVRGVRATGNGTGGSGAGIQCIGASCLFENCVASGNGSLGLVFLDTSSGYQNDVITGNTGGTVFSGTNMGANVCNSSATCP